MCKYLVIWPSNWMVIVHTDEQLLSRVTYMRLATSENASIYTYLLH